MFTETERNDIICALEIATEQYRKDAQTARGYNLGRVNIRLARQFDDQAERAEALIDKMQSV